MRKFISLTLCLFLISLTSAAQTPSINTPKTGENVSQYTFYDENNEPVTLDSFKGKFIFVDFWASWCKGCIMEFPSASKLKEKLKGQNIVFINVSADMKEDAWKEAMKIHKVKGINLWVGSFSRFESMQDAIDYYQNTLEVNILPRYWLVDKSGVILDAWAPRPSRYLKEEDLFAELQSILSK